MKNNIFTLVVILSILLQSCTKVNEIQVQEPPKELILNVISKVDGDLTDYLNVINEKVIVTFVKDSTNFSFPITYHVPLKINFNTSTTIKEGTGYNHYGPSIELVFVDSLGNELKTSNRKIFMDMSMSYSELAKNIKNASGEQTILFKGNIMVNSISDNSLAETKEILDLILKARALKINSKIIEQKFNSSKSNSNSDEAVNSSSNSDCNKFLKKYEEVIMDYIKLSKKIKNDPGNSKIIFELDAINSKIESFQDNIDSCIENPKFATKIAELQLKMAQSIN